MFASAVLLCWVSKVPPCHESQILYDTEEIALSKTQSARAAWSADELQRLRERQWLVRFCFFFFFCRIRHLRAPTTSRNVALPDLKGMEILTECSSRLFVCQPAHRVWPHQTRYFYPGQLGNSFPQKKMFSVRKSEDGRKQRKRLSATKPKHTYFCLGSSEKFNCLSAQHGQLKSVEEQRRSKVHISVVFVRSDRRSPRFLT